MAKILELRNRQSSQRTFSQKDDTLDGVRITSYIDIEFLDQAF